MAKTVMLTARISQEHEDFLIELGEGSRTKGLTNLLDRASRSSAPPAPASPASRPAPTRPTVRAIGRR